MSQPIVSREAVEVVRRATSAALAAEAGQSIPAGTTYWAGAPAEEIIRAVRVHRVAPLLASSLDVLDPPAEIAEGLQALVRRDALGAMRLAAESHRATSALSNAGIPALVYKGIALSMMSTGTLAARGAGDIDVLVRPEDVARAHDALTEAGWAGEEIPDAPRWWAYYLRSGRERSYASATSSIDLHWRVGWHTRPLPDASTLLARHSTIRIADTDLPTLSLADAFAVSCYTAMLDRYARLRQLVDIVRLARRDDVLSPPDMHWRLRRVVAESVTIADMLLGGVPRTRLASLDPHQQVDRARLESIWQHNSVRRLWFGGGLTTREMATVYRDSARFAGLPEAARMTVVDGLLPPKRIPAGAGPIATVSAVTARAGHFVRRWVLPTGSSVAGDA